MARALLVLVLGIAAVLSGCLNAPAPAPGGNDTMPGPGGSGSGSGSGGNMSGNATGAMQELSVSSSGQYPVDPGFAPATLQAHTGGTIHLVFTNADAVPVPLVQHNWVLEGVDGAGTDVVAPGASAEVMFPTPPAGEYAYYCSVGDHRERGMEGTLTVA